MQCAKSPRALAGYLTLPGGPDQYWATCDYPALTAYVCLNGFALVFALAAIVAVTYGPLVLIRRERPDTTWRPRVVNIGLFHLTLSLVTLLAAFACAGFVVALVGAPEPKCANVLCSEGGVPCSAFSVSLTGVSIKGTVFPYVQRTLSPEVAKLNNSTFGNPAGPVFCQDYTYIARFQPFAWQHPHLILNQSGTACEHCECPGMEDARYSVITNPCFGVFSMSTFGNASLSEKYHDDELGTDLPKPNAYAMWCTTGSQGLFAPVAGGWLPIMLNRTAALLGVSAANLTSNGAVSGACSSPGYTVDRSSPCSGFPSFNSSAGSNINGSIPAVHMLHGVSNPWLHQALGSKGSINNSYLNPSDGAVQSVVCPYALNMGWDGRGVLSCPKSDPASGVNYANCKVPDNSYNCSSWPLYPAYYYAALQYQCSSLVNGTLCDFGVSPPYAVDEDGNYLQRTQATSRGSFIVSLVPNPITGKIWPVIVTMLVVAVAANVLTFSILGCFEWGRMQRCWGRCMGYLIARPSKVD